LIELASYSIIIIVTTKSFMNYRMTKKQAVEQFRWDWSDFLKSNPHFRGDSIAKRCAFNDYVDGLNKDGLVTDYQAYNWSNPF